MFSNSIKVHVEDISINTFSHLRRLWINSNANTLITQIVIQEKVHTKGEVTDTHPMIISWASVVSNNWRRITEVLIQF